ncbi:MAG: putative manganese transporter [Coriobacteriales bacterium]
MFLDALIDAGLDSLKLLPFLFLTYLLMEWLEHGAAERFERAIAKAGKAGPVIGGILGIVPQCGFSGAAATLYAGRVITLGTLVSVFLVTSDEMLPVMISQQADPLVIAKVLGIKLVVGVLVGFCLDAALRAAGREHVGLGSVHLHQGHSGNDIRELCAQEGCDCADGCDCSSCERYLEPQRHAHAHEHEHEHEHGGAHEHAHEHGCCDHGHDHGQLKWGHLAFAALRHSLHITVFVFIICLLLNLVVEAGLEGAIAHMAEMPLAGAAVAAVLGLIPNCAVSVALTQLYLDGALAGGAMMSGLLVNAGVGLIVLMRTNNDSRENLRICGIMVAVGIAFGLVTELLGIL